MHPVQVGKESGKILRRRKEKKIISKSNKNVLDVAEHQVWASHVGKTVSDIYTAEFYPFDLWMDDSSDTALQQCPTCFCDI